MSVNASLVRRGSFWSKIIYWSYITIVRPLLVWSLKTKQPKIRTLLYRLSQLICFFNYNEILSYSIISQLLFIGKYPTIFQAEIYQQVNVYEERAKVIIDTGWTDNLLIIWWGGLLEYWADWLLSKQKCLSCFNYCCNIISTGVVILECYNSVEIIENFDRVLIFHFPII